MKKWVLLFLIGIYSIFFWTYKIGYIPQFKEPVNISLLLIGVLYSILSLFILYAVSKLIFHSSKPALLSSFIFSVLPWTTEEARIGSDVNQMVLILLLVILISLFLELKITTRYIKMIQGILLGLGFFFILFFFHKPDWFFQNHASQLTIQDMIVRIFHFLSPQFLFVNNDTFIQGGNHEWGIMLFIFLLFFLVGISRLLQHNFIQTVLWIGLSIGTVLLNPYFPEGRELYLVSPLVCAFIGFGLSKLTRKGMILITLLFFVSEYTLFVHDYMIHYPQRVRDYYSNYEIHP